MTELTIHYGLIPNMESNTLVFLSNVYFSRIWIVSRCCWWRWWRWWWRRWNYDTSLSRSI